jgi:hypothetical protein
MKIPNPSAPLGWLSSRHGAWMGIDAGRRPDCRVIELFCHLELADGI